MRDVEAVVVGGGLGGLLAAVEMQRRGIDVVLLDAAAAPGGIARTIDLDGFSLEPAVGSLLLPDPNLNPILEHAGVAITPAVSPRRRYLYGGGKLVPVGPSPAVLVGPILGPKAKLRALAEPFIRPALNTGGTGDESLCDLLVRRLGREAGELAAHVMASGVFAGDPRRLSAAMSFPGLPELESSGGSLLRGALRKRRKSDRSSRPGTRLPVGGTAAMADGLAGSLGERYLRNSAVGAVRRTADRWVVDAAETWSTRSLVLAVAPDAAASLLSPDIAIDVPTDTAPVDVVWLGGPATSFPLPEGFGYISGPDSGFVGLGCLFESSFAPFRSPAGMSLVKVIAGGALHPGLADRSEDDVVEQVTAEVGAALGITPDVTFSHVVRHRQGIPQYTIARRAWLADLEKRLADPGGVHLAGWAYRGIGVRRLAGEAVRIATTIAQWSSAGGRR